MPKIDRNGEFEQQYAELCQEDHLLESEIKKRIRWFKKNPKDSRLDNHSLTKKMIGKLAFSITDDIRIVYEWTNQTTVRFLAIGLHSKVYPRKVIKKRSPKR